MLLSDQRHGKQKIHEKKIQPTIKITNLVQKSSCNTICTLAEKLHLQYKMLLIKKTLQLKTQ